MADETSIVAQYLYALLSGSSELTAQVGLRIYDTDVPEPPMGSTEPLYPCVVFQQQASSDTIGMGAVRIMSTPLWIVQVLVEDQLYSAAGMIYALVDQILHGTSGDTSGGQVFSCYRESAQIRFSEAKDGGG